jgi:hypothetical protein
MRRAKGNSRNEEYISGINGAEERHNNTETVNNFFGERIGKGKQQNSWKIGHELL